MRKKIRNIKILVITLIILITIILYNKTINKTDEIEVSETQNEENILNIGAENLQDNYIQIFQNKYDNVNQQQIEKLAENIIPHEDESGRKYITYEDINIEENVDDYKRMLYTHQIANKYGYDVKATKKEYNIYKEEITSIKVETNTDWNGAKVIIHDENIKEKETRNYPIFQIRSKQDNIIITDAQKLANIEITTTTSKIQELSGNGLCLCIVYDENEKQYIRSGENANNGKDKIDLIKIDNEGNLLNEVQWNFDNITKIVLIPIPEETITIQNGNFITKTNENNYEQEQGYMNRNIICNRSNTKIANINHKIENKENVAGPYYGFLQVEWVSDVVIENCYLTAHKYETKSSYDFILEYATDVKLKNIYSDNIQDNTCWGITGTSYVKDIIYENCILNRIDAHCGVHNLTINNCKIGIYGITVVGSGELNIVDTTVDSTNSMIYLRDDYGATWNGTINIKNCALTTTKSPNILYFKTTYDGEDLHNYGYELYLPNIIIDGLKIEDNNISNQYSNLYIFKNTAEKTGTVNGDMRNNYNLPQSVIIKNYQTTSGRKVELFSNKFYNNLEEIGINLSMPLSDKEEAEVTYESGETIIDGTITNRNIKISKKETEGIETIIKINDEKIMEREKILEQEGKHKVDITYQNIAGEQEKNIINVVIDKTAPKIIGVENGKCYYNTLVNPLSYDSDIKLVELYKNGEKISYELGNPISEEGLYNLLIKDNAQNETKIGFEIKYKLEPESEEYSIDGQYILGVRNNTTLEKFIEILNGNVGYTIYRNEAVLQKEDIVATGDTLVTEYGKTFYIIVKGDITKDGITNIKDLVQIRRKILGLEKFDELQLKAADMFSDEVINIKDLVRIRRIILGIE